MMIAIALTNVSTFTTVTGNEGDCNEIEISKASSIC